MQHHVIHIDTNTTRYAPHIGLQEIVMFYSIPERRKMYFRYDWNGSVVYRMCLTPTESIANVMRMKLLMAFEDMDRKPMSA